tara:strand:- start:350 stop:574 length:225 start_codon:yes stop_codon:yes gene_type:complete
MRVKINIFINGLRGEQVLDFLLTKKIEVKNIFVSKKFNYVPSRKIIKLSPFFLGTSHDLKKKKLKIYLLIQTLI